MSLNEIHTTLVILGMKVGGVDSRGNSEIAVTQSYSESSIKEPNQTVPSPQNHWLRISLQKLVASLYFYAHNRERKGEKETESTILAANICQLTLPFHEVRQNEPGMALSNNGSPWECFLPSTVRALLLLT